MKTTNQRRTNGVGLIVTVIFSSASMLWMVWHFPLATTIAAVAVLSLLALSARLARSVDGESIADLEQGNQSA